MFSSLRITNVEDGKEMYIYLSSMKIDGGIWLEELEEEEEGKTERDSLFLWY